MENFQKRNIPVLQGRQKMKIEISCVRIKSLSKGTAFETQILHDSNRKTATGSIFASCFALLP